MNKLFQAAMAVLSTMLILGLMSCNGIPGAESSDLAPERPRDEISETGSVKSPSVVSGFVVDDAISGALVNVYTFTGGNKGELLASTTTNEDGSYTVELELLEAQPVLLEARGGSYVELATGKQIEFKQDEVLKAVVILQPGQPLPVMVTPLTHLVAALVEYRLASGVDTEQAITAAEAEINELFGFNVASVYPRSIADQGTVNGMNDEHLYGFFLSALSSWTKRISEQNGQAPHAVYNSIGLSQILYKEVASDGLLDGKAKNSAADNPTDLGLGVVDLKPDVYRISIAQHMLAMAASAKNDSGVTVEQLRPLAFRFLNSEHRLFAGIVTALVGDEVEVAAPDNPGRYRSGVFDYSVTLASPELISSVSFSVDDFELPVLVVPGEMNVPIDSRQFEDGEHTISMTARDWLGNIIATHSSVFEFDNTDPFVNVASALYTKDQAYLLSGGLGDNGSGIDVFEIQGQPVTINDDNRWSLALSLLPGNNAISVRLLDYAGNEFTQTFNIALDQASPVVDTSAGHSSVRFSNVHGEVVLSTLEDTNIESPVYQESDKLDLDGVAINRAALQNSAIPYFAFKTSDPLVAGVATSETELDIKMRYLKNGAPVSQWMSLTQIDGEYLVPLARETLDESWHRTVPDDEHTVLVRVTDKAGNVAEKTFSFRANIVVPDIVATNVKDLNHALFDETEFSQRGTLYGTTFDSNEYEFTNEAGKSMYLQFTDQGIHTAERLIERKVRENFVREVVTTEWKAEFIQNVSTMCDDPVVIFTQVIPDLAQIENYSGGQWVTEFIPAPVVSDVVEPALADVVTHPIGPQSWQALTFDNEYADGFLNSSSSEITYKYDYVLANTASDRSKPAFVDDIVVDYLDNTGISCPNSVNGLYERLVYSYESEPGYPRNVSTMLLDDSQGMTPEGIMVINETTQSQIDPENGWYHIPAGHTVKFIKRVTTPVLNISNHIDVAGPEDEFLSYSPRFYDASITWFVDRALKIHALHDAGFENIFLMTNREFDIGDGKIEYSISRSVAD